MDSEKELAVTIGSGFVLVLLASLSWTGRLDRYYEQARTQAYTQADAWPDIARQQARLMIEKYGPPERLSEGKMEWDDRWPWKRVIVSLRNPRSPLTQAVSCRVPDEKLAELARFPHGLMADSQKEELAARSDREALNFLTLNLGMDILTGRKTPEEASRRFYQAIDLHYAGRSVPYMEKLCFPVPRPPRRAWFENKI
jgi:hypothetical protein